MSIEKNILAIIKEIGEDPEREGLRDTPKRVTKAYKTLFSGYNQSLANIFTEFDGEDYDEMIICKEIDFFSTCEHHLLPFFGKVHIGYIPDKKILGLSKLPRLVEIYARRLQNQERLTQQIASALKEILKPKGVGVIIEAQHLCMMARGVQKQNASMTTSASNGLFRTDEKTRNEFLKLVK